MRILRFLAMLLAVSCLIIGLNNCASEPTQPTASAPTAETSTASSATSGDKLININSAILSELDKLEAQLGIPALSHKIQSSRPYTSSEELVSKGVLTQEQFDRVKDQVTIEEIVLTGEAKDADYLMKLGLMKGHMLVAGELLQLGEPEQAEPHLGHPVEEIYVDLEEQFSERNVSEFKQPLIQVQDLVKSKPNDTQIQAKFDEAMNGIDQAIAALPESQRQSPEFLLAVIEGMLDTASAEYTASISDGKISAAIEYQDSRGFVYHAFDEFYPTIKAKLDPAIAQQIEAKAQELKTAWPNPIPPSQPVLDSDRVAALVRDIQVESDKVAAK